MLLFWNVFRLAGGLNRTVWLPVNQLRHVTWAAGHVLFSSHAVHVFLKRVLYRVIFSAFVFMKITFSTYYDLETTLQVETIMGPFRAHVDARRTHDNMPGLVWSSGPVDSTSARPSWTTNFLINFFHICILMDRLTFRRSTIMEAGVHTSACLLLVLGW